MNIHPAPRKAVNTECAVPGFVVLGKSTNAGRPPYARLSCRAVCLFLLLSAAMLPRWAFSEPDRRGSEQFSRRECRWAVSWVGTELAYYMGSRVIAKVIAKEKLYEVQVGPPWYEIPFSEQGELVKHLSRSREITGHSPYFAVRDPSNNSIVARTTPQGIYVRFDKEGFFRYLYTDTAEWTTTF